MTADPLKKIGWKDVPLAFFVYFVLYWVLVVPAFSGSDIGVVGGLAIAALVILWVFTPIAYIIDGRRHGRFWIGYVVGHLIVGPLAAIVYQLRRSKYAEEA